MGWYAIQVGKIWRTAVKDKLSQDFWRNVALKDSTRWLNIHHNVHELWEEPPPDLRQGPAGHDYVLYGVSMGVTMGGTKFTVRAHIR